MPPARPIHSELQAAFALEHARICPASEHPGTWHVAGVGEPETVLIQLRRLPDGAGEDAFAEVIAQFARSA